MLRVPRRTGPSNKLPGDTVSPLTCGSAFEVPAIAIALHGMALKIFPPEEGSFEHREK